MYIAPTDRMDDDGWRPFVDRQGFGHLVVGRRDRDVPVVVPTQFVRIDRDGGDAILLHLARPNPVFEALAERPRALLAVAGDWAYIPSAWKAIGDEDPRVGIPTTYYAAVQLVGDVTVSDDPDEIAATLRRQLADTQPHVDAVDPADHAKRFGAIRAIRLDVTEVRAKAKFGGNADLDHRRAVRGHLVDRGGPGDAAAAEWMALD